MPFLCILGRKQTSTENWKLIVFHLGLRPQSRGKGTWFLVPWCSGGKSDHAPRMKSRSPFPLLCTERKTGIYIVLYTTRARNRQNNKTVNLSIWSSLLRTLYLQYNDHQNWNHDSKALNIFWNASISKNPCTRSLFFEPFCFLLIFLRENTAFPIALSSGLTEKILGNSRAPCHW